MEAKALYFGASPIKVLYQGIRLIWTGFEDPVQNGPNLSINQTNQSDKTDTSAKLDEYFTEYEAPILTGNSLAIAEVLGAYKNNAQVVIQ